MKVAFRKALQNFMDRAPKSVIQNATEEFSLLETEAFRNAQLQKEQERLDTEAKEEALRQEKLRKQQEAVKRLEEQRLKKVF